MRTSPAFLDLGYSRPETSRQPRGAATPPTPVHHPRAPSDRSPGAAALRELRRQLDHKQGMVTDGTRPGDDPFARRQLEDAYERQRSALLVYNTFAAQLGVPSAEAAIGGVPVAVPVPSASAPRAKAENRPATPLPSVARHAASSEPVAAAQQAAIEQARAAFFAKGTAK